VLFYLRWSSKPRGRRLRWHGQVWRYWSLMLYSPSRQASWRPSAVWVTYRLTVTAAWMNACRNKVSCNIFLDVATQERCY
jgi:hypothetical protein